MPELGTKQYGGCEEGTPSVYNPDSYGYETQTFLERHDLGMNGVKLS